MSAHSLYAVALAAVPEIEGPSLSKRVPLRVGTIEIIGRPAALAQFARERARKPGRDPNSIEHNLLLHAAYEIGRDRGLSVTAARGLAERMLGQPVTDEKVRRAGDAFFREMDVWFGSEAPAKCGDLLSRTKLLLQRLEADYRASATSSHEHDTLKRGEKPRALTACRAKR